MANLTAITRGMQNGAEAIDQNFKNLYNPVVTYTGSNGDLNTLTSNGIYSFEGWSGKNGPVTSVSGGLLRG